MDPIKEAFQKAKQDISDLKAQISFLSQEIESLKQVIYSFQQTNQQTNQHINNPLSAQNFNNPAHIPAHNLHFKALKDQNNNFSTGNEGVPTDRQTDQQTNQHTKNSSILRELPQILTSLEALKSEVRINFNKLTKQELNLFSTIYFLEEQGFIIDYQLLAQKFSLTESSIRDYVQRLIKKGIPLIKNKENNKRILLSISPEFKKILPFASFERLREAQLNRLNE